MNKANYFIMYAYYIYGGFLKIDLILIWAYTLMAYKVINWFWIWMKQGFLFENDTHWFNKVCKNREK